MKCPMPQPGSSTVACAGKPQAGQGVVHGLHHHRRGVEGGEGGALGAGILLRRQQGLQGLAQRLPGAVPIGAGDGIGEQPQRHGAEAGEAGQEAPLRRRGRALFAFDQLQRANGRQEVMGVRPGPAGAVGQIGHRRLRLGVVSSGRTARVQVGHKGGVDGVGMGRRVLAHRPRPAMGTGVWAGRGRGRVRRGPRHRWRLRRRRERHGHRRPHAGQAGAETAPARR